MADVRDFNGRIQFQSTHPLRGATPRAAHHCNVFAISIHAPLAGCDHSSLAHWPTKEISIHAPLAGCDPSSVWVLCSGCNFNPRTPCGVRLYFPDDAYDGVPFQSTHPLRGATHGADGCGRTRQISIHAPLAGCDLRPSGPLQFADISIHAPLAGCDKFTLVVAGTTVISIHAPLAGCDPCRPDPGFR